jgi:lipopolysaccharide export LptBFGC system permease protein LptF
MIPGRVLDRIAAHLCSTKSLEQVVRPAIADLQKEYADGGLAESALRRLWTLGRGYIAVMEVIVMCMLDPASLSRDDRRALVRTFSWITACVLAAAVSLIVLALARIAYVGTGFVAHVGYVAPQALPLALPIGLALGIASGTNGVVLSLRTRTVIVLAALAASVIAFGTIGWKMPEANESYRQALYHAQGDRNVSMKGPSEMTFSELRDLSILARASGDSETTRRVDWHYHVRPALALASVVLALFAIVLSGWPAGTRKVTVSTACVLYIVLLSVGESLTFEGLPPMAGAWLPNVTFAAATFFLWPKSGSATSAEAL